jgi:hypothetical protein
MTTYAHQQHQHQDEWGSRHDVCFFSFYFLVNNNIYLQILCATTTKTTTTKTRKTRKTIYHHPDLITTSTRRRRVHHHNDASNGLQNSTTSRGSSPLVCFSFFPPILTLLTIKLGTFYTSGPHYQHLSTQRLRQRLEPLMVCHYFF